jgi:hypothetical protein
MDRDNDATIVNTHFRQTLLAINQVLGDKAAMDIYFAANLENFSTALLADNMGKTFNGYDYARILETIEARLDEYR